MLSQTTSSIVPLFGLASTVIATLNPAGTFLEPSKNPSLYESVFTRRILNDSSAYGNFSGQPTPGGNFTVGIIGAGAAGLYSAILLESLGINYEILEADTRPGGRIYTKYFDEEKWEKSNPGDPDYYDYYVSLSSRIRAHIPMIMAD